MDRGDEQPDICFSSLIHIFFTELRREKEDDGEPHLRLDESHRLNEVSRSRMPDLVAYVDGGSHGNPGPSGIGVLIHNPDGDTIRIAKWIGHQDNNVAEYLALLEALQHAITVKAKALRVFSDSEIVVKQMNGQYACRSPRLYSLNWICRKLARSLEFSIAHIRRDENQAANALANQAVRTRAKNAGAELLRAT